MASNSSSSKSQYGGDFFRTFSAWYQPAHFCLIITIGIIGIVTNCLNIVVFSRPKMRTSANVILCSIAFSMLMNITANIFSTVLPKLLLNEYGTIETYEGALILWLGYNTTSVLTNLVLMHSVLLAVVRFIALQFPVKSFTICSLRKVTISLIVLYVGVPFVCIPTFLSTMIVQVHNSSQFYFGYRKDGVSQGVLKYNFYMLGTCMKLLPCLLLVIFTILLSHKMRKVARKSDRLHGEIETSKSSDRLNRTSSELQAVITLIVFVEAPQGFLNILSAIFGYQFSSNVTYNLINFFAMLTLLYNSIMFALYCKMNSAFWDTLNQLFKRQPQNKHHTRTTTTRIDNKFVITGNLTRKCSHNSRKCHSVSNLEMFQKGTLSERSGSNNRIASHVGIMEVEKEHVLDSGYLYLSVPTYTRSLSPRSLGDSGSFNTIITSEC